MLPLLSWELEVTVTVPSPASTLETALMAFMQQTAAAAAVAAAGNAARDARMTELLGTARLPPAFRVRLTPSYLPAIYHD